MLILTRRIGEALVIGDGATRADVIILGIQGNQVRIGVEAPKEIPVHRQEIFDKIQKEKVQQEKIVEEAEEDRTEGV